MVDSKHSRLTNIIAKAVKSLGFELIGCEHHAQGKHSLLRVYIDCETGVTLDACAEVSRQIDAVLDVEDLINGEYRLEVSSPGINRPLFTLEQYRRFIGDDIKIKLHVPLTNSQIKNQQNFSGKLKDVLDDSIIMDIDGQSITFAFSGIKKANLLTTI